MKLGYLGRVSVKSNKVTTLLQSWRKSFFAFKWYHSRLVTRIFQIHFIQFHQCVFIDLKWHFYGFIQIKIFNFSPQNVTALRLVISLFSKIIPSSFYSRHANVVMCQRIGLKPLVNRESNFKLCRFNSDQWNWCLYALSQSTFVCVTKRWFVTNNTQFEFNRKYRKNGKNPIIIIKFNVS